MKYVSTRKGFEATSAESVFQGLAPDGGLYVPVMGSTAVDSARLQTISSLRDAEEFVMGALFDDLPAEVRKTAVDRLCARFPENDPIPLVEADGLQMLELFHGKTGAFKDVALSMLPVLMKHAAGGKRVLILTATSGDTGSAAMQGFAGVEGTEIAVLFPATGTSKIQRLQMTTPADPNVHAIAIRGNFDDAQAAVKRIFADKAFNAEAAAHGITLSSANSINTGRLVPQIAYYVLAGAKLAMGQQADDGKRGFDVVVSSGNFGNILAAYYAKLLGAPIRKFVCASNINDVLARFVKTGVYDPGPTFTVTNSPSMDIRKSSNVERLLWMLNLEDRGEDAPGTLPDRGEDAPGTLPDRGEDAPGTLPGRGEDAPGTLPTRLASACAETARLMDDLATKGRYELKPAAKAKLVSEFVGGVATPEETEAEMRRMREACGYLLDPHTAVGTCVAKKLIAEGTIGDLPVVVAATATPYKFPETCQRAFGENVLTDPPPSFRDLEKLPIAQKKVVDVGDIDEAIKELF